MIHFPKVITQATLTYILHSPNATLVFHVSWALETGTTSEQTNKKIPRLLAGRFAYELFKAILKCGMSETHFATFKYIHFYFVTFHFNLF